MPVKHVRIRVRQAPEPRARPIDQRVATRMPRVSQSLFARVRSLPVDAAARRRFTARSVGLAISAYNRRDFDALLTFYDPAVKNLVHHVAGIEGVHDGHAGWRHYWRGWFEAWDESHQEVHEIIDFADERLLLLGRTRCRDNARGLELEEPFGMLLTIRDGRIIRHEEWFDQAAAMRAAGLADETPAAASAGSGTG